VTISGAKLDEEEEGSGPPMETGLRLVRPPRAFDKVSR